MSDIVIHILATALSGCIVSLFNLWLHKDNDKNRRL